MNSVNKYNLKGLITEKAQLKEAPIGKRYGRLVVTGNAGYVLEKKKVHGKPGFGKKAVYNCACDCGNEHLVRAKDLRRGSIKSCGCLHKETSSDLGKSNKLVNGNSSLNLLYGSYKHRAKKNKFEFDLSKEKFMELTSSNCYYCDVSPYKDASNKQKVASYYVYNGLDRVNCEEGYTIDNVVPCCEQCNKAKLDYTQEEFYNWLNRIFEYQNKKNSDEILKIRLEQNLTNV